MDASDARGLPRCPQPKIIAGSAPAAHYDTHKRPRAPSIAARMRPGSQAVAAAPGDCTRAGALSARWSTSAGMSGTTIPSRSVGGARDYYSVRWCCNINEGSAWLLRYG